MPRIKEHKRDRDPNYQARERGFLFDRIKSELESVEAGLIDEPPVYNLSRPRAAKLGDIYTDQYGHRFILLSRSVRTKRLVSLVSEDRSKSLKIDIIEFENNYKRVGSIYQKTEYDDPEY